MTQQQPLLWVRTSELLNVRSQSESQGLVVPGKGMGANSKEHRIPRFVPGTSSHGHPCQLSG